MRAAVRACRSHEVADRDDRPVDRGVDVGARRGADVERRRGPAAAARAGTSAARSCRRPTILSPEPGEQALVGLAADAARARARRRRAVVADRGDAALRRPGAGSGGCRASRATCGRGGTAGAAEARRGDRLALGRPSRPTPNAVRSSVTSSAERAARAPQPDGEAAGTPLRDAASAYRAEGARRCRERGRWPSWRHR